MIKNITELKLEALRVKVETKYEKLKKMHQVLSEAEYELSLLEEEYDKAVALLENPTQQQLQYATNVSAEDGKLVYRRNN